MSGEREIPPEAPEPAPSDGPEATREESLLFGAVGPFVAGPRLSAHALGGESESGESDDGSWQTHAIEEGDVEPRRGWWHRLWHRHT